MVTAKLPGKAAKKVAKKAAKKVAAKKTPAKAAKKAAAKQPGSDARRAYEHLQRLRALQGALDASTAAEVQLLGRYARAAFAGRQPRDAAHLLRAAEHLAFAALAPGGSRDEVSGELRTALKEEWQHQLERGAARWSEHEAKPDRALRALYKRLRAQAKAAWKDHAYAVALESARALDALAHAELAPLDLAQLGDETTIALPGGSFILPEAS